MFLIPVLAACSGRDGQLKPLRPGGEGDSLLAAQPQLVTFSELQAEPEAYEDRLIRVSGSLLKLPPPECLPKSGPAVEWALIAEELRLDAIGFERIIGLLTGGLPMTVDGFFRLYEGPLGCGKGALESSAWFLEVIQIVQPNPLVNNGQPSIGGGPASATPGGPATPAITATPPGTGTPGGVPTMTPTGQATSPPTATATPAGGTPPGTTIPTATATAPATSALTPTAPPTPPAGTPTPTPIPSATPTFGPPNPPTGTPLPTATPTSDGYPGQPTPTVTPTREGYPPVSPTITPSYP